MKRDMDLIRKIALFVEAAGGEQINSGIVSGQLAIDDYPSEQIMYHCQLMSDAGLLIGEPLGMMDARFNEFRLLRLSWSGHEFIDAARNDTVWNAVTKHARENAISLTFTGLKAVLIYAGAKVLEFGTEWIKTTDWKWLNDLPFIN